MRSQHQIRPVLSLLGGLLAASATSPVLAESSTPAQGLLDNPFVLNLGAFVMQTHLKARLDGQSVNNPYVDFDTTFGRGNDATRIRADALWRITPTQHARLMYFDNTSTRARVLDQPIQWGDYTFQSGARVEAQNKLKIWALAYEYAFVRQPTYEVAASLGVHYSDVSMRLSGDATVIDSSGNVIHVSGATQQNSLPVPLPLIGLHAGWVVAPQWHVEAHGQFFKAKINGYDGLISDWRAGATWMFSRNLGVGLGYNRFFTRVNVNRESFDGGVRWGYSGLQAFLTSTF